MKVAVIGGGSTYTPELMDGLICHAASLGLGRVALMDVDAARLQAVGGFCQRMARKAGARFDLRSGTDPAEALAGADFVLTQIRVGGQAGRHKDIQLGLRHGLVGQETTGVGGFAKALRTVPAVLGICEAMRSLCPDAWLINFTNPSGLVTEAIVKHATGRVIGLCNIPVNLQMDIASHLGVRPEQVELDSIGLNHLSWVRRVLVDGEDVLPDALKTLAGMGRPANIPEELDYPAGFLLALGMIPSSYLRYYYQTRLVVDELKGRSKSRAEEVMEIEDELMSVYRDPEKSEKPVALSRRGGAYYSRAAVDLMLSIVQNEGDRHVVNVPNGSCVACLSPDAVVEVPCRVDAQGAHPLPLEPPQVQIRGLLQQVKAYEELAVEAAVTRSRRASVLALVNHPLVGDADLATTLVEEIASEHGIVFEGE